MVSTITVTIEPDNLSLAWHVATHIAEITGIRVTQLLPGKVVAEKDVRL